MAAFLNTCRFTPNAGGTTDWTVLAAVTGYKTPATAGAVNGRVYKYRAESANLSQWEEGEGAYNSGTGVLARTAVLANSSGTTAKINFAAAPQVAVVALKEDLISIEEANNFTAAQQAQARANIGAASSRTGAFAVDRNGADQTGLAAGNYNKIVWTNEPYDADGWFDVATGRFTPQAAGLYLFILTCTSNVGTPTTESCQSALYKNGSRIKNGTYIFDSGLSAASNLPVVATIPMNGTTDFVEAYVYMPNGISVLSGLTQSTHFQGYRIG
jgi:hypothetical protein